MATTQTINSQELTGLLEEGRQVFVLDVRPIAQRQEWHIPESTHIDAYERLNKGDVSVLDEVQIPDNAKVVTVCAAGRTSLIASDALRKKGYDAYSLEGGMKAWNYAYDTRLLEFDTFKVIQVRRVAKGCLSYIVGSGSEALVVDASLDPSIYDNLAKAQGWEIKAVTDTHIHADYISRTRELAASTGAKHAMNSVADVGFPFTPVANGDLMPIGKIKIKVMHTPGHTWESTAFSIEGKVLLTGDTLFTDGIGRPDLKADESEARRKAKALFDSLQLIKEFPDDTLILPAHISTPIEIGHSAIVEELGTLKKTLPALSFTSDKFLESVLSKLPTPPANYLTIAEINKSGNTAGFVAADLEAGANRCAVK